MKAVRAGIAHVMHTLPPVAPPRHGDVMRARKNAASEAGENKCGSAMHRGSAAPAPIATPSCRGTRCASRLAQTGPEASLARPLSPPVLLHTGSERARLRFLLAATYQLIPALTACGMLQKAQRSVPNLAGANCRRGVLELPADGDESGRT
jgi:hypothetical protein